MVAEVWCGGWRVVADVMVRAGLISPYIQGPNGKEIEKCATKCLTTCTRGGDGAPGWAFTYGIQKLAC